MTNGGWEGPRERRQRNFRQAVLGLRWFRQDADITALGRDHGTSRATAYRYVDEVIGVLADQAPDLHEALERAKADGLAYAILDGKIFSADRCSEKTTSVKGTQIDLWYSGSNWSGPWRRGCLIFASWC